MDKLNLNHVPIKDRNVTKGLKYVVTTFFAQFGNSVHGNRITGIPRHSGNLPGHLSQGPLTAFEGKDTPFHNKTLIGNVSYKVLPGDKVVVNIPYYAEANRTFATSANAVSPNGTPLLNAREPCVARTTESSSGVACKLTALGAAISR